MRSFPEKVSTDLSNETNKQTKRNQNRAADGLPAQNSRGKHVTFTVKPPSSDQHSSGGIFKTNKIYTPRAEIP